MLSVYPNVSDLAAPQSGLRIAVVGAGMAGATCAHQLAQAGLYVQVFDKSRGLGGRMAHRRMPWPADRAGQQGSSASASASASACASAPATKGHAPSTAEQGIAAVDHGAPFFTARTPHFKQFLQEAEQAAVVAPWTPSIAPHSFEPLDATPLWLAQPNMSALCRHLLQPTAQLHVHTETQVEKLLRDGPHWRLQVAGQTLPGVFDGVVLALPPAQASTLLLGHHAQWAEVTAKLPTLPCWTLLGVAAAPTGEQVRHGIGRPLQGPLATVIRDDLKPGRSPDPAGLVRWVVHATAQWSHTYLEAPVDEVLPHLQAALSRWLREPVQWHCAQAHRWRYATVARHTLGTSEPGWWNAEQGLGLCADFLGGGGVEGAWVSGRALARAVLEQSPCA
jgi:renalase